MVQRRTRNDEHNMSLGLQVGFIVMADLNPVDRMVNAPNLVPCIVIGIGRNGCDISLTTEQGILKGNFNNSRSVIPLGSCDEVTLRTIAESIDKRGCKGFSAIWKMVYNMRKQQERYDCRCVIVPRKRHKLCTICLSRLGSDIVSGHLPFFFSVLSGQL